MTTSGQHFCGPCQRWCGYAQTVTSWRQEGTNGILIKEHTLDCGHIYTEEFVNP